MQSQSGGLGNLIFNIQFGGGKDTIQPITEINTGSQVWW